MNNQIKDQSLDLSAFGTKVEGDVRPASVSDKLDLSAFGTPVSAQSSPVSMQGNDGVSDVSDRGFIDRRSDDAQRGWNRAMQGIDIQDLDRRSTTAGYLDQIDAGTYKEPVERWERLSEDPRAKQYRLAGPEERAHIRQTLRGAMDEDITDLVSAEQNISELPQSAEARRFGEAEDFGSAWEALADAPVEVISSLATESLGQQSPYLPLMAIHPALGAGAGSYITEKGADIINSLREAGVDFSSEQSIRTGLSDPDRMAAFRQHANRRGLAIGLVDAISGGLAGKYAAGATTTLSRIGRGAVEDLVMQPALGAAGEAVGAIAAGDEISGKELLAEAAGEIGPGAVETTVGTVQNVRRRGSDSVPDEGDPSEAETLMLTGPDSAGALPPPEAVYGNDFVMTKTDPSSQPFGEPAALPAPDQFGRVYGEGFVAGDDLLPPAPGPNYIAMVDRSGRQTGWFNPETAHAVGKELGAFEVPRRQGPSIDEMMTDGRTADEIRAELVEKSQQERASADVGSVVRVKVPGKRTAEQVRVVGFTPDVAVVETRDGQKIALSDNQIPQPEQLSLDLSTEQPRSEVADDIQNNRLTAEIEQAAQQAQPPASEAQAEAGNYRKGHVKVGGLDIAIENQRGSIRSGQDRNGKSWSVEMPAHYGYIKRTEGADGDHVDVYVGPEPDSQEVYVIDQMGDRPTGFDEHKVMIGFKSAADAQATYLKAFNDGRGLARLGAITPMSMDQFKTWLREGDTKRPVRNLGRPKAGDFFEPVELTLAQIEMLKSLIKDKHVDRNSSSGAAYLRMINTGTISTAYELNAFSGALNQQSWIDGAARRAEKPKAEEPKLPWQKSFNDFMSAEFGQNWVVAEGNKNLGADDGRIKVSPKRFEAMKAEHKASILDAIKQGKTVPDDALNSHSQDVEFTGRVNSIRAGNNVTRSSPRLEKQKQSQPSENTEEDNVTASQASNEDAAKAYDLDAHNKMTDRLETGDISPEELVVGYKSFMDSFDLIKSEMAKKPKKELARYSWLGLGEKKDRLLNAAMDALRGQYNTKDSISYNPFSDGSKDAAYLQAVQSTTSEDIANYAKRISDAREARSARAAQINKAISNPETYDEFQQFVRYRGADALTDDQRARYDELIAEKNHSKREAELEERRKVSAVDIGDTDMEIVETKHTRDGYDLFVVRLGDRVEKDVYKDLLSKAKQLGGWYSRYRGNGAVPGFQFKSRENAESFVALRDGDSLKPDNSADKAAKVTDHLRDSAGKIADKADEKLSADRKVNTARRASMAANAEAAANKDKMIAETMSNIADAIESGKVKHLSQIRFRTDVDMLNSLLRQAQYERIRTEKIKTDWNDLPALSAEDVKYVRYPFPSAHGDHVTSVSQAMLQMSGFKLVGKRLQDKAAQVLKSGAYRVAFKSDHDIADFDKMAQAASQAKSIGSYIADNMKESKADYSRVVRLGLPDTPTLRAALREFLEYRGASAKVDPVKAAERALIGTNIPGYFPTPRKLVERMIDEASIEDGMTVLEPSAGKGSIADNIREITSSVDVVEPVSSLRDILEAKGHNIVASDFLDFTGKYDRILMNPPFEKRQDVEHVRHAYEQLAPGGRMVAIMSEGPFFGSDKKAVEFREWLESVGGVSEKNPDGSFKDSDRSTGVATRMVTIDKTEAPERYRLSDGVSKKRTQLEEAVIAEIKRLAPSVIVEIRKNGKTLIGGKKAEAGYIPVDDLIWTAMDAADPTHAGRHEVVHHLRATGRITDAEWSILSRKAKATWRKQYRVEDYREQYAGDADIETVLDEEAVAEAFADWMEGGSDAKGGIARIFRKIKQFFDRIASVVRGQGYQSAEDVFRSIDDGEVGKRATNDLEKMKQQRSEYFAMSGLRKKSGSAAAKPKQKASPLSDAQEAAIKRTMANIEDEQPMGVRIRETLADAVDYIKHGAVQHIFDQFDSIKRYEKATYGELKRASMSAYKMARLTTNLQSTMAAVLRHGPLEYKNGAFQVRKGFDGGFEAIFADLADRGLLKAWKGWAVANRAARLAKEGRENNMTAADIALLKDLDKQYPEFRDVMKRWTAFNKAMLDMAEQTGLLDPDARALFEHDDYVPFYRAMDDKPTGPFRKKGLANQRSGINRLKGGEAEVNDLIDNMVRNMTQLVDASMKNVAAKRVLRTLKTAGLDDGSVIMKVPHDAVPVHVTPEEAAQALENIGVQVQGMTKQQHDQWLKLFTLRPPKDPDVVSVMVGGKPQYFRVNDPLLLSSMTSLGTDKVHWLVSILGYPKRWLTTGVTATPGFMLRNFIRDSLHGWVVSGERFRPGIDGFRGAMRSYREDTALVSIMAAGGGSGGFFRTQSRDVAKMLSSVHGKNAIIDSPKKAWEWWKRVGQATENANRLAIYDSVLKDTGDVAEAAYQALDIMDFSMRGDSAVIRFLIGTIPFLNARMQGLYRLGRGMKQNPKAFLLRGGLITAATMLLYSLNADDDRYDELPEWEKDAYYHIFLDRIFPEEALKAAGIPFDEFHIRLPKPFEVGALFSTIPERATRLAQGKDDLSKYGERMWSMLRDTFAVDLPQFVKPLAEQWANEVTFTGSPIIPERMQDLEPEAQYDARTSELAKQIGDALPDFMGDAKSPKRIEAAVRAFFGSYGVYVMGIADEILDPVVGNPVEPDLRGDQLPEIGSFIRQQPLQSTRFVSEFYDLKSDIEAVAKTYKQYRSQGQIDDAKELSKDGGDRKIAMAGWMRRKAKQMSGINKKIREIEESRQLSSSQKRSQIDQLSEQRNELAEQVVKALNKAGIK
ncbi:LPD38 domain-containing protein [Thalassospira aquimaris]|uniref:Uncharacterized protein n=1 Tax=Thalassospira aquimaris TaxID=3037796 RepID=A0ABT6GH24_9PROT|nr:LPD38 domain-containing protein [Thalassospira sp. FZY0004]MDG4721142.1 hypothetical protein [Thalassospira sp. FZY0004]